MDQPAYFHHALYVDNDRCNGCVHCMRVCPTEAIRVVAGRAVIESNKCIDCGSCFRVCPTRAIKVEQDDLSSILDYPVRVALIPAVFVGQFPDHIKTETIYGALYHLGFTLVLEVEHGVEVAHQGIQAYIEANRGVKPLISSYCPSVIRLIQVKYPSLTDHIIRIKTPHDISAIFCRKYFEDQGYQSDQVGIFYVTPCAAKIAAVKSPVGERISAFTGVINMDFLYNRVLSTIFQESDKISHMEIQSPDSKAIRWSLTRGEVSCLNVRALAVDGIQAVCNFLEKVEMDQVKGIDFLELKACQEGCPGGILTAGNSFLTVENMESRAQAELEKGDSRIYPLQDYAAYLSAHASLDQIEPRSGVKLDHEVGVAMTKLEHLKNVELLLPGIDCSACGAPNCHALAEDIALDKGSISQCPFMEILSMSRGQSDPNTALGHAEEIWTGRIRQ